MPVSATPAYLGQDFSQASPGLRFGMYLQLWGIDHRSNEHLWTTADIDYGVRGQERRERTVEKDNKTFALQKAGELKPNDQATMRALAARQAHLAATTSHLLSLSATTISPFTTGLGNEHPLENGFSFLNPYGLPYLPGSGIKGVLRQAARELASGDWGDTQGWTTEPTHWLELGGRRIPLSVLDVLFGLENSDGSSDQVRGALTFWDAIPQIPGDRLAVDIMTPHQSHYYQRKTERKSGDSSSPHDSGQPIPIPFLTLPPGTSFSFHVRCDVRHLGVLAPDLAHQNRWQTLLVAAFEHAFEWLGFGAKTAVGYGAMESMQQRERQLAETRRREAEEKERQKAATLERQQQNAVAWEGARVKFNRSNGALSVEKGGQTAFALAPEGEALLKTLPADLQQKIRSNQFVKVKAHVAEDTLVRVEKA